MRKALGTAALTLVLALSGSLAAAADKTQTSTGNIARLSAAERTVVVTLTSDGTETRFVWSAETKINGTLAVGAKVTIRYTTLPDGQNLAHQISVGK